jgi:hypothetical protein
MNPPFRSHAQKNRFTIKCSAVYPPSFACSNFDHHASERARGVGGGGNSRGKNPGPREFGRKNPFHFDFDFFISPHLSTTHGFAEIANIRKKPKPTVRIASYPYPVSGRPETSRARRLRPGGGVGRRRRRPLPTQSAPSSGYGYGDPLTACASARPRPRPKSPPVVRVHHHPTRRVTRVIAHHTENNL